MEENKQKFYGDVLLSWQTAEFEKHHRTKHWYFWMIIITAGLVGWSFWTGNVLFSLIILMAAIMIFMLGEKKPRAVPFSITNLGIVFGEKFVPYKDVDGFWIAYEPPDVKNVYFDLKIFFTPRFTIDLGKENPVKVREVLLRHIKEDLKRDGEPLTDIICRIFKI